MTIKTWIVMVGIGLVVDAGGAFGAQAQDVPGDAASAAAAASDLGPGPLPLNANTGDVDREPASTPPTFKKRAFAGAADEEDLRVQTSLPEAAIRIDARSVQRDVYKQLYNQELKEETQNDLEE